jgi:predicted MFS family arabinose efflux permease
MVGRALIGVAIGGFWSMSAATAMRLVPEREVPRALAILNGGNALAAVVAAAGQLPGRPDRLARRLLLRGAARGDRADVEVASACRRCARPSGPAAAASAALEAAGRGARAGAVGLFFMGQFALFTYLRPFLETVTRVDVSTLSLMLLLVGVAGVAGTTLIGRVLEGTAVSGAGR